MSYCNVYIMVYFSVMNVLAFILTVVLSCYVVNFVFYLVFYLSLKARGLGSRKTGLNPPFFLKMPCTKSGNGSCNLIVCFCVALSFKFFCYTSVFLLFCCFSLIVGVFTSVLVSNPDLFSVNRFMTFEQRYTTVACIYV